MRPKPKVKYQEVENHQIKSVFRAQKKGRPKKTSSLSPPKQEKPSSPSTSIILTPKITTHPPILRSRAISPFPSGYYRLETLSFPQNYHIELTQIDLHFILDNKEKYRFYDFFILNEGRLIKTYSLFSQQCEHINEKEQLRTFLEKKLLDFEEEPAYRIFQLFRTEKPHLFEEFTSILTERWLYRNKIGNLYITNQPQKLEDAIPFSNRERFRKLQNQNDHLRMRNSLHKQFKRSIVFIKHYQQLKRDHDNRKSELVNIITEILRNINLFISLGNVELLPKDLSNLSLLQLDQKLKEIIQELCKWKIALNKRKRKSISAGKVIPNVSS